MNIKKLLLVVGAGMLLSGCQDPHYLPQSVSGDSVIYGNDDRLDLYDVKDPLLVELARSTVALVRTRSLVEQANGDYKIAGRSYQQQNMLCSDERFVEQDAAGFCSGSLIGPDLVLTAAHCLSSCDGISFVFDYAVHSPNALPTHADQNAVYHCQTIVSRVLDGRRGNDFAIVRLDREVVGRSSLNISTSEVQVGDPVVVIGHPSGLPTKVAGGANVNKMNPNEPYFVANVDTYGGNSGSAVFNPINGEIVGILVRGATDFKYDSKSGCARSNYCPDSGCAEEKVMRRGEDIVKASAILQNLGL